MTATSKSFQFHSMLFRKLEAVSVLTNEEKQAIRALLFIPRSFSADEDIVQIGDRPLPMLCPHRGLGVPVQGDRDWWPSDHGLPCCGRRSGFAEPLS
jgi:hypothetical protein